MMARLDKLVQDRADSVDRSLENIERITAEVRAAVDGADVRVQNLLKNLEDASADAKAGVADARELIKSTQDEIKQVSTKVQEKLDRFDTVIDPTAEVMQKVNDPDKGTLGRLVGDTTIADNIEDITEDAKGFLGTLFGMQTYVGLRSEYNINAGDFRHYIAIELHTRPDKFYYIELEKGPRGRFPDISLVPDGMGGFQQTLVIEDKINFTFQFAKRLDWLTLRFGLKESTGGVGADLDVPLPWFDNKLKLSVDAFDAAWAGTPRLKLAAAYQMFGYLYILGGVDDVLIEPTTIPVTQNGLPDGVPSQLSEFHYGRDVFFGAMLRFNDLDLAALLTVGGALVTGAVE